jgi:hypothetical protein
MFLKELYDSEEVQQSSSSTKPKFCLFMLESNQLSFPDVPELVSFLGSMRKALSRVVFELTNVHTNPSSILFDLQVHLCIS